jgi:hypothetical protein
MADLDQRLSKRGTNRIARSCRSSIQPDALQLRRTIQKFLLPQWRCHGVTNLDGGATQLSGKRERLRQTRCNSVRRSGVS